jgi:lipoyl(octanoyl) transferase
MRRTTDDTDAPPRPAPDVAALTLRQRQLGYEITETPGSAAVLIGDHPRGVTLGRAASRVNVKLPAEELHARDWPLSWVARGGGTMLHLPGQVTCYPILPLADFRLTPAAYVSALVEIAADVVASFDQPADADYGDVAVRVRGRRVAHIGVAVSGGVTRFGFVLNVLADLGPFRDVHVDGDRVPMTSLHRETTSRVTEAAARRKVLDALLRRFDLRRDDTTAAGPFTLTHLSRYAHPDRH